MNAHDLLSSFFRGDRVSDTSDFHWKVTIYIRTNVQVQLNLYMDLSMLAFRSLVLSAQNCFKTSISVIF